MEQKTTAQLKELRIGDSFIIPKREDPWRVMAREDKRGKVAINQIINGKPVWPQDTLVKGTREVMFLRHTIPVSGEQCFIDDLTVGDVFTRADDIHEWVLEKHGHAFSDVRRIDQSAPAKAGRLAIVTFIKHKE